MEPDSTEEVHIRARSAPLQQEQLEALGGEHKSRAAPDDSRWRNKSDRWADVLAVLLLLDAVGRIVRDFLSPNVIASSNNMGSAGPQDTLDMCSLKPSRNSSLYCRLALLAVSVLVPLLSRTAQAGSYTDGRARRSNRLLQCLPIVLALLLLLAFSDLLMRYEELLGSERSGHRKQLWSVGVALAAVVCCCCATLTQLSRFHEATAQSCSLRLLVAAFMFMHNSTACIKDARYRVVPIVTIILLCIVTASYNYFKQVRPACNALCGLLSALLTACLLGELVSSSWREPDPRAGPLILWLSGWLNPLQSSCAAVPIFASLSNHTLRYIDGECPADQHRKVVFCGNLDHIPAEAANGLMAAWYKKAAGQCDGRTVEMAASQQEVQIQNSERYLRAFCGSRYNYFVHIPTDVPTVRRTRQLKHNGPSLLTLNFDGLSAVQFESQLPQTSRLLKRLNGHTAYRFHKYHAVACCTIANECLLMTGERTIHLSDDSSIG